MKRATTKPRTRAPGSGRKPLDPNGEVMKKHYVRTTDAQWEKLQAIGGIAAFRVWLDSQP